MMQNCKNDTQLREYLMKTIQTGSLSKTSVYSVTPEEFQNSGHKLLAFVMGNLHCSMFKIPALEVFDTDVEEVKKQEAELDKANGGQPRHMYGHYNQNFSQVKDCFMQGFVVINNDTLDERKFQEAKKEYGSVFQWHGSALENYYSILRNGLMNLSNTHLMTAGAAYGQGIYTANYAGTSLGYCNSRNPHFQG